MNCWLLNELKSTFFVALFYLMLGPKDNFPWTVKFSWNLYLESVCRPLKLISYMGISMV